MKKKTDVDIARQILNENIFGIRSFLPTSEKVTGKLVRNPSTTSGEFGGGVATSGMGVGREEQSNWQAAGNIASDAAISTALGTATGIGGKNPLNVGGRLVGNIFGDLASRAASGIIGNDWASKNRGAAIGLNMGSYVVGDQLAQKGAELAVKKGLQTATGKLIQKAATNLAARSGISALGSAAAPVATVLAPLAAAAGTAIGGFQIGNALSKATGLENYGIDPSETAQGRINTIQTSGNQKAKARVAAGQEKLQKLADSGATQEELNKEADKIKRYEELSAEARKEEIGNIEQGEMNDSGPSVGDQFKAGWQASKEAFGGDSVTAKSEKAISDSERMTRETGEFQKTLQGMTPRQREEAMAKRAQDRAAEQEKNKKSGWFGLWEENKTKNYYNILLESLENVSEELGINFQGYQPTRKAQRAARVYQKQLETRPEISYSGDSTVEDQATKPRADGGINHEAFVKNAVIDLMTKAQTKGIQMTHGEAQNIAIKMLRQKMGD